MHALILGNLTLDKNLIHNRSYQFAGGSSFFTGVTLKNLGFNVTLVSPYGYDFPKKNIFGLKLIPAKPTTRKTLIFKNIYNRNKTRLQMAENLKTAFLPDLALVKQTELKKISIAILASVIDNIDIRLLKRFANLFPDALKVLLPQGLFRKVNRGVVAQKKCAIPNSVWGLFDVIVVSDEDSEKIEGQALKWGDRSTIKLVTKAEKGVTAYYQGKKVDFKAFNADTIRDVTGAGDIFAAAFAYAYLKSKDLKKSVNFGQAAASLSLPLFPNELKYGLKEIVDFAKRQGSIINL